MTFDEMVKKYTAELINAEKQSKVPKEEEFIANEIVDEVAAPIAPQNDEMTGTGFLKVVAQTANNAFPIPDVFVRITHIDENGNTHFIKSGKTDINGETEIFALPTKPEFLSQSPDNDRPFSSYNIESFKDGYFTILNKGVPIFDKQTSQQSVNMIPLPENFNGNRVLIYEENEPNNL